MMDELSTPLAGYVGQAYNYDDQDLTEEWMVTFKDPGSRGPSESDVIRTQVEILLEVMLGHVQDRVCTANNILQAPSLALNVHIKEVPVWGIDCYTRKMVEMAIEDSCAEKKKPVAAIKHFIEKKLLPTINCQPVQSAHNMAAAARTLLEVMLDHNSAVLLVTESMMANRIRM